MRTAQQLILTIRNQCDRTSVDFDRELESYDRRNKGIISPVSLHRWISSIGLNFSAQQVQSIADEFKDGEGLDWKALSNAINNAKNVLNPVLKTLDRESLEYMMARFWVDNFNRNAEAALVQRINKEENSQKKGKMQFYMGLFYEIMGGEDGAVEMYSKVAAMQAPMFFEFRIAEWGMKAGLEAQKEKQANAQ